LSRGLGRLADTPIPQRLRRAVLTTFARSVGIDVDEAERPLEDYPSVNAFFVRRLRPGSRSWPTEPGLTSPVDGIVGQVGRIEAGRLIQAKGLDYAAADLLEDPAEAACFDGGEFVTIYLSPRHYHRIHAPVGGTIPLARYVPGALLPVNQPAVQHVPALFARNERLLAHIDGSHGRVAVVALGAYNVGRISAAFDAAWSGEGTRRRRAQPGWVTNRSDVLPRERRYTPPLPVGRGDEFMAFHLGSTVVLLTEPGRLSLDPGCRPGAEVRLGTLLARPV
jgi:phosphatidylserine decarboxylase